jgi:hypothetical protein
MATVLGLLGILVWIAGVIGLAAAITFGVIRLTPGDKPKEPPAESPSPSS